MTLLAPHLTRFLREYLPLERRLSAATIQTYTHAFMLLVRYSADKFKTLPSMLNIEQLSAPHVVEFLGHLGKHRQNSPRTRNARLAAVNAFFRYIEYQVPACIEQAQRIHAIPATRTDEVLCRYLDAGEIQALLDAPDPRTPEGTRDRAMLHLAFAAGLRVSELVGLSINQLHFERTAEIHVMGKGRRERALSLWKETVIVLRNWIAIRDGSKDSAVFLNSAGYAMSRAGFSYILDKYVKKASRSCPSLGEKRVTPHVLRHSFAMHMLAATNDIRVVSLLLGHNNLQSTEIYLRGDLGEKRAALNKAASPIIRPGRFRPPDRLIAMLRDTSCNRGIIPNSMLSKAQDTS
jgi:integrase/recombinase XerD